MSYGAATGEDGATPLDIAGVLRATAGVVSETTNIDGALRWAVTVVCGCTGWPLGHILRVDPETGDLVSTEIWSDGDPSRHAPFVQATRETQFAPGEGLPGRILATAEPYWITDVRSDPNFPRGRAAAKAGLGAA